MLDQLWGNRYHMRQFAITGTLDPIKRNASSYRWQTLPTLGFFLVYIDHVYEEGFEVEFKLCVVNNSGTIVRWEDTDGNRCFAPKGSLLVEFVESNGEMKFKPLRKHSDHYQVLSEWRNQKETNDAGKCETSMRLENQSKGSDSLLFAEFTLQLTKAVTMQKQEYFLGQQSSFQQSSQLDFGNYDHHSHHTHYIITDNLSANWMNTQSITERIYLINTGNINTLEIIENEEISLFHLFVQSQDIADIAEEISSRWKKISKRSMKGLIIAYLEQSLNAGQIQRLIEAGVRIFIVDPIDCVNMILQVAKYHNYVVSSNSHDIFMARRQGEQLKIIMKTFKIERFLMNLMKQLQQVNDNLKDFYFHYDSREFDRQLQQRISAQRAGNSQILVILHVEHIQSLEEKTIQALLKVSLPEYKVTVFVITNEKIPHNLHRLSLSRHRIIFLNTLGEVIGNSGQAIDLYFYLQINRSSFQSNQNIILEQLGSGLNRYYRRNGTLVIEFPHNTLGCILKKRALQLVRDVNNKSIAKLIPHQGDYSLQLIPFCLHPTFLYQAILATYALMVKRQGLVIVIDGTDRAVMQFMNISEVEENMKFLSFYLHYKQLRPNYPCNPLSQYQLQRMLNLLSAKQEDKRKGIAVHIGEVLTEIKNIN